MVVIDERQTGDLRVHRERINRRQTLLSDDSGLFPHIPERSVPFVVKKEDAIAETHGEVGEAIVVIISRCAGNRRAVAIQAGLLRHIFEFAVSQIVVERHRSLSSVIG
jgi:hypothetical protein